LNFNCDFLEITENAFRHFYKSGDDIVFLYLMGTEATAFTHLLLCFACFALNNNARQT